MKNLYLMCLLSLCALNASSFAAQDDTASNRVPTVTRLVQLFTSLEAALIDTQVKADSVGLGALLTDNFEMRIDTRPGEPIPRAEWLKQVLEQRRAGQLAQMAVHDHGEIAIVSFQMKVAGQSKQAAPSNLFIVDVWRRSNGEWKLATRYAANASHSAQRIPGVPLKGQVLEKRY